MDQLPSVYLGNVQLTVQPEGALTTVIGVALGSRLQG